MASEAVLKELFQVAKASQQFSGMSDKDIWNACLSHKDNSDDEMYAAMENIRTKDQGLKAESAEKQNKLEEGKQKMIVLHEEEEVERQKDAQDAEDILDELFNSWYNKMIKTNHK